jgi:hypothetical protein
MGWVFFSSVRVSSEMQTTISCERARCIVRETTYSGLQEHRNTEGSTGKAPLVRACCDFYFSLRPFRLALQAYCAPCARCCSLVKSQAIGWVNAHITQKKVRALM